jgi:hypothetical protein
MTVYYKQLTKILNGELNENYLITTKIAVYYKQLTKIIFNDNVDNIARKSITPCALGKLLNKGIYLTFKNVLLYFA